MDSPIVEKAKQCDCVRCRRLVRTRHLILGAQRPAGQGITDGMVSMWNEILATPCERDSHENS